MFILILISHYFSINKFNTMKGNVWIIKRGLISLTWSLQRSGYSMEYHGNHYFFNIKNECFCIRKVWCPLSYYTLHMLHKILSVSGKEDRFPILSNCVGYFDHRLIRSKIWCNMTDKSKSEILVCTFSYLFVYQKSIARGKIYNCTIKPTKMTKSTSFRKLKLINLVNWIRFAYVCIIFETTTLCYLFLTTFSMKNVEEK